MSTPIIVDTFNRASGAVGNGWLAQGSSSSAVIASDKLQFTTTNGSQIGDYLVYGTTPGRDAEVKFTGTGSVLSECMYSVFRLSGTTSPTCYLASVNTGSNRLDVLLVSAGSGTFLVNDGFSVAPIAGHAISSDIRIYGINPTLMDATITDTVTSSVLYSVTAQVLEATSTLTSGTGLAGVGANNQNVGSGTALFTSVEIDSLAFAITDFWADPATPPTSGAIKLAGLATGGTAPFTSSVDRILSTGNFPGTVVNTGTSVTVSFTDSTVAPSTEYIYRWQLTDSEATPVTLVSYARVRTTQAAYGVGFIGDSTYAFGAVTSVFAAAVANISPETPVTITNVAYQGTTSNDWLPGGAYLPNAITTMTTAGVVDVMLQLGTNDSHSGISAATYQSNIAAICAALVTAGFTVYLHQPYSPMYDNPTFVPGGNYTLSSLQLVVAYSTALDAIVNGTTIRKGDRQARAIYQANAGVANWSGDGIHPGTASGPVIASLQAASYLASKGIIGAAQAAAATNKAIHHGQLSRGR